MANFDISNPTFNGQLRRLESSDPNHADTFNANFRQLIENDQALSSQLAALEDDYTKQVPYAGITGGTANTYTISTPAITVLVAGIAVSLKFNLDSTGASTLNWCGLGAKPIKKVSGANATNLKTSGIYTLRYDGTNFILQGEGASGTAIASDLLLDKTASTDVGDIVGTMPNRGSIGTQNLTTEGAEYTIPAGYHNGLGKVKVAITGLIASVIKAGTTVGGILGTFTADATAVASHILNGDAAYVNGSKVIGSMPNRDYAWNAPVAVTSYSGGIGVVPPEGYFAGNANYGTHGGVDVPNADFIPANILSGKAPFGLAGTLVRGKKFASGSANKPANQVNLQFVYVNNGGISPRQYVTVTGLTFLPSQILIELNEPTGWTFVTIYSYNTALGVYSVKTMALSNTYTNNSQDHIKVDGTMAYVNSNGFQLPVQAANYSASANYNWIAFE